MVANSQNTLISVVQVRPSVSTRANGFGLGLLTLTLFFFSGAFALVYQVSWVRAITLEFGSTTLAVSTVLTVFMGGLALGAWVAGNRIDKSQRPLSIYGALEGVLAVYTLVTPLLIKFLLPLVSAWIFDASGGLIAVFLGRFIAAILLLLPPTVLMGATLPALARFWARRGTDTGRWVGLLYGVNTLGAFAGTLASGFLLLPELGLTNTLYLVAGCNVALAIVAILTGLIVETRSAAANDRPANNPITSDLAQRDRWAVYFAVLLTGFAALICEVAWTRTLVLVLGASVFAFVIVLATFLAGLGMGSAIFAAWLRAVPERAPTFFFSLALAAAIAVSATSISFQHLPPLFVDLYATWNLEQHTDMILLVQALIASLVMLLPSFVMGGLFPTAVRILIRDTNHTGANVGRLYTWNTIGAIIGSFAAGFLLIPWLGIQGTLQVAVSAQVLGAIAVLFTASSWRKPILLAVGSLVALALLVLFSPSWDRQLMTSAAYHYAHSYESTTAVDMRRELTENEELLYYRDGLTATVTVSRDNLSDDGDLYISTNGKIDGSSHYDMPTQRLIAHIPLLFHPDPKEVVVVGMGTGSTAGSAGLYPVNRVTLLEIEEAMVEGARFFRDDNHAVHDNPKVAIHVTDGRLFLNSRRDAFDVVISEPSNPWLSGVSDLFTQEFFEIGARALHDDGIFAQWVQVYGLSPANVKTVVRTFNSVFPYVYLASSIPDTDIILLGSRSPFTLDLARASRRMRESRIKADLADKRVRINSVFDITARIRMGPNEVKAFIGDGVLHTDDLPVIAYNASRDLYKDTRGANMASMASYALGVGPYLDLSEMSRAIRVSIFGNLANSYRSFLPAGREAKVCRKLMRQSVGLLEPPDRP